jgi:peptide/nickel transport system ATP-binding protein
MTGTVARHGNPVGSPGDAAAQPLLRVRNLSVTYPKSGRRPPVPALRDVTVEMRGEGETVGVVGESGSGKTTLGKVILGQVKPASGTIEFAGEDITHAGPRRRRELAREIQVVFQDPYGSLNPARTIGQTLAEPLTARSGMGRPQVRSRVAEALERVGLPASAASRYPAQFSGGQRQRIGIARAIIAMPRLIICDEPVSALDLSVQAQILNLLRDLQREFRLNLLFIAHDLPVVRHVSHRIVVLYHGSVMEEGPAAEVYQHPRHPYTQALLAASPVPDPRVQKARKQQRRWLETPAAAPRSGSGCPFLPRCPHGRPVCAAEMPALVPVEAGRTIACVRHAQLPAPTAPATTDALTNP